MGAMYEHTTATITTHRVTTRNNGAARAKKGHGQSNPTRDKGEYVPAQIKVDGKGHSLKVGNQYAGGTVAHFLYPPPHCAWWLES
jgi:hypothetical protein